MARAWFQSEEMPLKQVSDIFLEMYDAHDRNAPSLLHVFDHTTSELIEGRQPRMPPQSISLQTLNRAQQFVDYAETQKQIVMEVSPIICCSFTPVPKSWG